MTETMLNESAALLAPTSVMVAPSTLTALMPSRLAARSACAARDAMPAASRLVKSNLAATETRALPSARFITRSCSPLRPCGAPIVSVHTVGR